MCSLPKLPQDLRSRLLSFPEVRRKSIKLPSSSSDRTLLLRLLRLPFGVISVVGTLEVSNIPHIIERVKKR